MVLRQATGSSDHERRLNLRRIYSKCVKLCSRWRVYRSTLTETKRCVTRVRWSVFWQCCGAVSATSNGQVRPQVAVRQECTIRRQFEHQPGFDTDSKGSRILRSINKTLSKMLFNKGPEFRRRPLSPYREGGLVNRATMLFSFLGRGIFGLVNIVLLVVTVAAGSGVDLPTSKKGWFALAAVIGDGTLICLVMLRWMHLPVAQR